MQDNLKYIDKLIEKNRIDAQATRRRADVERNKAASYDEETQLGTKQLHEQEALALDLHADNLETEANTLEPKKVEIEAKITELKIEREKINRETVDRTLAIDKELARIQGSMTI